MQWDFTSMSLLRVNTMSCISCDWSNSIHSVQLWMHWLELFQFVVWSFITNACFVHVFTGAGGEDPDSGRTSCAPRLPHVPPRPATRERQHLLWSSGIWHNPWPQAQALAARGLFSPSVLNQFTSFDPPHSIHFWLWSIAFFYINMVTFLNDIIAIMKATVGSCQINVLLFVISSSFC